MFLNESNEPLRLVVPFAMIYVASFSGENVNGLNGPSRDERENRIRDCGRECHTLVMKDRMRDS